MPVSRGGHETNLVDVTKARAPVFALATDYPAGHRVPAHSHDRGQLLHALSGVVAVQTALGRWIVPPAHALWIPARLRHAVDAIGAVRMRSVYVRGDRAEALPGRLKVMAMEPLMQALIVAAVAQDDGAGNARDRMVQDLLLAEIPRLEERPLALPLPHHPRLAALCRHHLSAPGEPLRLDTWAAAAGMSRRSLSRHFREETGLSLDAWRQQAALFAALPRLAQGEAVTQVALDLGYGSPAAFSAMVRRVLGLPPSAFQHREG